ncbi:MAG: PPK2 family polyphosphate kinase [Trueperaceae bacterium]|nr:PPK2 family polyphosphate kinase [Trueperaceae bacterium]
MEEAWISPTDSPFRVPFDGSFVLADAATAPPEDAPDRKANGKALGKVRKRLRDLQRQLYADDRFAVLLVFQAMDAAGKDGTIRHVLRGVNPAGCQVTSFEQPSRAELDHDFLWRIARALPQRGRIGVFNRSHYEEALVVRVHPSILAKQRLPGVDPATVWDERLASMASYEQHLAREGTVIVKFFLHLSKQEQARRFLDRIDEPEKNWKFSTGDVRDRGHWDAYQHAYQEALRATSRPWAPWFAVPADDKRYMRRVVGEIVHDTMRRLPIAYPRVSDEARDEMLRLREELVGEVG